MHFVHNEMKIGRHVNSIFFSLNSKLRVSRAPSTSRKGESNTICVRDRIWLAVRAASSSEDSSVSSWFVRVRLGVLLEQGYSWRDGVSPLSILSSERRRTPQLKLSMLSPWKSKKGYLRTQLHAYWCCRSYDTQKHTPRWKITECVIKSRVSISPSVSFNV